MLEKNLMGTFGSFGLVLQSFLENNYFLITKQFNAEHLKFIILSKTS
jgi:hypothetical protein